MIRKYVLQEPLLSAEPGFLAKAKDGLDSIVRGDGTRIADIVYGINHKYSTREGEDLFKLTNKTSASLGRLGMPITCYDDYTRWIDDLYFVFYEGPGSRRPNPLPESFIDINVLRVDLRHDTDHGKPAEIRAKKKKAGLIFKKYSGATSPNGLEPGQFEIVQANVLASLKRDLQQIAVTIQ